MRIISHIGGKTRDCGAYCGNCRVRPVRFKDALCLICREEERDRNAMGAIVAIFLAAALLAIGFISAHGTYVRMNP